MTLSLSLKHLKKRHEHLLYSVIIALRRTFSKLEVSLSQLKREKQRLHICIWNIAEYFG